MKYLIDAAFVTALVCGTAYAANYNMPLDCNQADLVCHPIGTAPPDGGDGGGTPPPSGDIHPVPPITVGALTYNEEFKDIFAVISDSTTHDSDPKKVWYTQTVYCCTGGQLSKVNQTDSAFQQLPGGGLRIQVPRAGGGIIATYSPDNQAGWTQTYGYLRDERQIAWNIRRMARILDGELRQPVRAQLDRQLEVHDCARCDRPLRDRSDGGVSDWRLRLLSNQ